MLKNIYFNNHLNEHIWDMTGGAGKGFFHHIRESCGHSSDKNNSCCSLRPFNTITILHGPLKYVKLIQK